MNREISISGAYNVRDLGGYSAEDGTPTRWRTLIRAGNLNELDASARQQVLDLGVKTIIDLRDEWEVESYPHVFAQSSELHYTNLPLIGNALSQDDTWKAEMHSYETLAELYIKYLECCRSQIRAIITIVAERLPGVLFHCHAGKDRTGIIAALLLSAVGVSDEQIAADYALTNKQIRQLVDEWRAYAQKQGSDMQVFERDVTAAPETMINMLAYLRETYGGSTPYLENCGVASEHLAKLKSAFVNAV